MKVAECGPGMDQERRKEEENTNGVTSEDVAAPVGACLELLFDHESNVLTARVSESAEGAVWSPEAVQARLEQEGFATFSFEPNAVATMVRHLQSRAFGDYEIARRLDAEISVSPTADKLQVLLSTTRVYGGAPVTEGRLRAALAKAGIAEDLVSSAAIQQALAEEVVSNLVVAQGLPPKSGNDSRIELLVDLEQEVSRPRESEDGRVDHYSVRDFVIVEPGTPLMRRHPPTKGIAGRDVFGKAISARDGKDIPLPREMPGVLPDQQDPTLFVAEYKGHPVPIAGGIRVDKTLLMDYVDLRTGNVDFDGSVLVKQDVSAGVTVKATGDITIKGTSENAYLEAGGDLAVACGITGSEAAMNGGARDILVTADGSVHAGFAAGVKVRAGADVVVKEYLNHCETLALGRVLVGQKGGHGLIVGGRTHGCLGVFAQSGGSPASVKTFVGAGPTEATAARREAALQERKELVAKLEQLKLMLANMEAGQANGEGGRSELIDKVRRTIEEFERRTVEVDVRIDDIEAEAAESEYAGVTFKQRAYPGVSVELGDEVLALRTESSGGHFVLRDGEIVWE